MFHIWHQFFLKSYRNWARIFPKSSSHLEPWIKASFLIKLIAVFRRRSKGSLVHLVRFASISTQSPSTRISMQTVVRKSFWCLSLKRLPAKAAGDFGIQDSNRLYVTRLYSENLWNQRSHAQIPQTDSICGRSENLRVCYYKLRCRPWIGNLPLKCSRRDKQSSSGGKIKIINHRLFFGMTRNWGL